MRTVCTCRHGRAGGCVRVCMMGCVCGGGLTSTLRPWAIRGTRFGFGGGMGGGCLSHDGYPPPAYTHNVQHVCIRRCTRQPTTFGHTHSTVGMRASWSRTHHMPHYHILWVLPICNAISCFGYNVGRGPSTTSCYVAHHHDVQLPSTMWYMAPCGQRYVVSSARLGRQCGALTQPTVCGMIYGQWGQGAGLTALRCHCPITTYHHHHPPTAPHPTPPSRRHSGDGTA